jgi:F-type H+-transporting ATPase subunit gamma
MAKTKEIQQRIKSVKNTKKITKAMEMVAAAKMRKSIEAVLKTRSYANLSWMTVLNISNSTNNLYEKHPLLTYKKDIKKVCVVLITANRGLCGSLNTAIVNKAIQSIEGEVSTDFILLGKRGSSVHKRGHNIIAEFDKNDALTQVLEVRPLAKMIVDDYLANKYDKVMVAYTDFVNAVTQVPRIKQIIPVDITKEDGYLGVVGEDTRLKTDKDYIHEKEEKYLEVKDKYAVGKFDYVFEPNAEEVLNEMVPRLVEAQLFQALLESNASEHSARMNAMRNATSAASDIIDELTLFYNKARQASITSEIAEISAGANALK